MIKNLRVCLLACVVLCGMLTEYASAQFLPNNTALSIQSVQRWMDSNRDFAKIVQVVDAMNPTEADLKKFERLPIAEQDKKINALLQEKNLLGVANVIASGHGWKSVGEYMRFSTKLGDAIAAYFLMTSSEKLNEVQKKAMRDKADPVILAVPSEDIAFVKANEKFLRQYIQAYSVGR